jgi:hypothetical protein
MNPGYRKSFTRAINFCYCDVLYKPLTIMCCQHRRPREANIFMKFPPLPVKAALPIFDVKFLVGKQFFLRGT